MPKHEIACDECGITLEMRFFRTFNAALKAARKAKWQRIDNLHFFCVECKDLVGVHSPIDGLDGWTREPHYAN